MKPKPGAGFVTYWDTNLPGFGVRVSPKGRKTWIAVYHIAGDKDVMESIGTIDLIPKVIDGRNQARASMGKARAGIHPVEERKQQKQDAEAEEQANAYTYAKLIDDFIERYLPSTAA